MALSAKGEAYAFGWGRDGQLGLGSAAKEKKTPVLVKGLADIVHVSAMGPLGGGRTEISGRLKRHYSTIAAADTSRESVAQIFMTILGYFLQQRFGSEA